MRLNFSGPIVLVLVAAFLLAHPALLLARRKPVIGITGYVDVPGKKNAVGQFRMNRTYRDAVLRAGGLGIRLLPVPLNEVDRLLDLVDGVVLCGGPDIDPAAYGEKKHETVNPLCKERQDFDFTVARRAMARKIPLLGICLGSQIMNVVRGGSLVQDIPSAIGKGVKHRPGHVSELDGGMHRVDFLPKSRLRKIYGKKNLRVNSYHHQAVKHLGSGLQVAARSSKDKVVEAVEDPSLPFAIGVQFHPEWQIKPRGVHSPLFKTFIAAAREYHDKKVAAHCKKGKKGKEGKKCKKGAERKKRKSRARWYYERGQYKLR